MKKSTLKRIALGLFCFTLIFSIAGLISPQKTHALYIVSDIEADISDTLINLEGGITSEATLGENIQDTILDKIATAIAKQLLMQITQSVINWINSGFNGNPSFVQNPSAFFQNIGDQLTDQFISQNGALSSLCSPFSLQIRLAIALQQQQNDGYGGAGTGAGGSGNQYSCTLSTIIQNSTNAVNGAGVSASVQGFTSGDFSQGGFSAFAALTTQPQNNPNGAYLIAEDNLQQQINGQITQKQNELSQGQGFLSWETCTPNNTSNNSGTSSSYNNDLYMTAEEDDPNENCSIQTPGSVISATLNKHLAVPTENLELADSINDIINAAFSELIVVALQKGLTSVTSNSNGGASYLQSAINSANSQSFTSVQSGIITTVKPYLTNANSIDENYSAALSSVLAASSTLGSAISCYATLLSSTTISQYPSSGTFIQNQISSLQNMGMASVTPLAEITMAKAANASSTNNEYQQMYNQTVNAQTLADLAGPNQTLSNISLTGGFPTTADVQSSANDLSTEESMILPIQQQATVALQKCQSFNFLDYGGFQ